ncbi:MAG: hypothetical protein K2N94_16230, partial [Lachnospiraceae bacterium]|nr:hypothetical protein [Lachnospiraceae bacterium]
MLWSNIRFICRHYFHSSRSIFLYLLLGMAALLLLPVLSVYLPRVVVQAVMEGWKFERLALWVGVLAAAIALLNILSTISGMGYREKTGRGRLKLGLYLNEVVMTCDYSLTEDPAWQTKIE